MKKKDSIRDPEGRYKRTDEIIGMGSYKIVYKAIDQEEGIEVAWNEINLSRFKETELKQIFNEIKLLGSLDSPRIIKLFHAWIDKKRNMCVFITEYFQNKTIRDYVNNIVRTPSRSAVSNWCKQILEGLSFIHNHDPPVMHRDLKCDNLFIDGSEGIVKIGDFGLSKAAIGGMAESVIGTPAFTAPEVWAGKYTTKTDIWSFGLCVLEMITGETPYSECGDNVGAIYLKVKEGILPHALTRISHPTIADFITICLLPESSRPTADQLLEHPLITEFETPEINVDEPYENDELDFIEPFECPSYQILVARHQEEIEQLKKTQYNARVRMRATLRQRKLRSNPIYLET